MYIFQNWDLLSIGIAIAGIGVLGFTVFLNNRRSVTNRVFFYLSIAAITWSIFNYISYQILPPMLSLIILRLVFFFAIWFAFLFFELTYVFPLDIVKRTKFHNIILLPVIFITSFLTLTPIVVSNISIFTSDGRIVSFMKGPGIVIFGIVVISLLLSSFWQLFIKWRRSNAEYRSQLNLITSGLVISFLLLIIFNFIFPAFLNNPQFVPLGALFIFPFIAFTSYAIIRHKLFNIKVVGAALLVFGLSIVSFIEVTLADNILIIIYRSSVLFFILVFGILLIRSVLKEVRQREQIETMAKELERAYAVEKKANEELEKLDEYKNNFLRQTQHDLRRPLTIIMGYSDVLINGASGKLPKKAIDIIKKMQVVTRSKVKDINNFLDIEQFKASKGVVSLKPGVELLPILDEIVNELSFVAQSKSIYLKLEKPLDKTHDKPAPSFTKASEGGKIFTIKADREKLKSALFNIIDNAVKYTEKGGVDIKVEYGQVVKIIVSDTGIGISPEKIQNIFVTQFERTKQAQQTAEGRGVGLYLSSQIIKLHNGKVWVESKGDGKGSTFYVELPIDRESIESPQSPNQTTSE